MKGFVKAFGATVFFALSAFAEQPQGALPMVPVNPYSPYSSQIPALPPGTVLPYNTQMNPNQWQPADSGPRVKINIPPSSVITNEWKSVYPSQPAYPESSNPPNIPTRPKINIRVSPTQSFQAPSQAALPPPPLLKIPDVVSIRKPTTEGPSVRSDGGNHLATPTPAAPSATTPSPNSAPAQPSKRALAFPDQIFRERKPNSGLSADLTRFIEDNTQKAQHDGYYLINEVGRWASPTTAIEIWSRINKEKGNDYYLPQIVEVKITQPDCKKLKGVSAEVCLGLQLAYKRKECPTMGGEVTTSCKTFGAIFSRQACENIWFNQSARSQCSGVSQAMSGASCSHLTEDEMKLSCEGAQLALNKQSCEGSGREFWHALGYSNTKQAYCDALSHLGFESYVKLSTASIPK